MIELTNIKATDTVGQLRGQINRMQNEIMADQPTIGACVNPNVYLYNKDTLAYSLVFGNGQDYQKYVKNYLNAVILPNTKNTGCFLVGFKGQLQFRVPANKASIVDKIVVTIPSIRGITAANARYSYDKFITPGSLGLNYKVGNSTAVDTEYLSYTNCQYMHRILAGTVTGPVTVPPYLTSISTYSNSPIKMPKFTLLFDKGNIDFTHGADGFITF